MFRSGAQGSSDILVTMWPKWDNVARKPPSRWSGGDESGIASLLRSLSGSRETEITNSLEEPNNVIIDNSPDEVRRPEKTRVEVVRLEGFTFGRFTFEPGWR